MVSISVESIDKLIASTGKELAKSDWLEITQKMVDNFADLTGDPQWIHIDKEKAAAESPFGGTVAHGFLTASLMVFFMNKSIEMPFSNMGVNYGFNKLRFTSPVLVGSRLRSCFTVKEVKKIENGVQIVWNVIMECEGQTKPVLVADWVTRRYQ